MVTASLHSEAEFVSVLVYNVTHTDIVFGVKPAPSVNVRESLARSTFSKFLGLTQAVYDVLHEHAADVVAVKVTSMEGHGRCIGFDISAFPVTWKTWDDFRLRNASEVDLESPPIITHVFLPLMCVMMPVWLKSLTVVPMSFRPSPRQSPEQPAGAGGLKRKAESVSPGKGLAQRKLLKGADAARIAIPSPSVFTTTASSPRRRPTPTLPIEITGEDPLSPMPAGQLATINVPIRNTYTAVYFTSGSGSPRNPFHSKMGNSTLAAAKILAAFVSKYYHHVVPHTVHSGPGVFRGSHNVNFVNTQLRPLIDCHRRSLSKRHGGDWESYFRIAIALTDGTPARLAAVSASLRNYKPMFLHMWQLKAFWHARTVSERDVDTQTFEDWETRPPVTSNDLSAEHAALLKAMIEYKERFEVARDKKGTQNELESFWLRKTRKPVLSTLMVRVENGDGGEAGRGYKFVHGINSEVSMPTGSLCSERNAIGQALASNPCLKRSDILHVAVLSVDLQGRAATGQKNRLNPLAPCGACMEWLKKIAEVNPDFTVMMFDDDTCERVFVRSVYSLR